jgi:hypothetical protein
MLTNIKKLIFAMYKLRNISSLLERNTQASRLKTSVVVNLAATPELEAYKRAINVTSVKAYLLHCK